MSNKIFFYTYFLKKNSKSVTTIILYLKNLDVSSWRFVSVGPISPKIIILKNLNLEKK